MRYSLITLLLVLIFGGCSANADSISQIDKLSAASNNLRVVITSPASDVYNIEPGDSVNFACNVSGGIAPYAYSWSFPIGTPTSSTAEDPGWVTYPLDESYHDFATVVVTDGRGKIVTDRVEIRCNWSPHGPPPPIRP